MRYFKLTLSFSLLLAFSFSKDSLGEDSGPQGLIQFQKQVANSIKKAQSGAQAEMVLDFLRQKFMLPNPPWSLNPYPSSDQVATTKPRIKVNSALSATDTSLAPRWEIRQRQEGGICINLPSPVTSTAANLAATDCPASAVEFVADNSTFASIEKSPARGSEQRGFIVLTNPSQLSEADRLSLFSNPNPTSNTSTALLSVPVKFLSYVTDPTNAQRIRLKVAVGDVVGEVPIPPPFSPPSCTLTVRRNPAPSHTTCSVTITSSAATTNAQLTSHPSVALTQSGNNWTNASVNCATNSETTFSGSVRGSGSPQSSDCSDSVTVAPFDPCNDATTQRFSTVLNFPAETSGCEWEKPKNNRTIAAAKRLFQLISLPAQTKTLCSLELATTNTNWRYDDNAIFTFGKNETDGSGFVIASGQYDENDFVTNAKQTKQGNLIWFQKRSFLGTRWPDQHRPSYYSIRYCSGCDEGCPNDDGKVSTNCLYSRYCPAGTTCTIPRSQQRSQVSILVPWSWFKSLPAGWISGTKTFDVSLWISGDDDPTNDCRHSGLTFSVEATYSTWE